MQKMSDKCFKNQVLYRSGSLFMQSKVDVPRRKSLASLEHELSIEYNHFLWALTLFLVQGSRFLHRGWAGISTASSTRSFIAPSIPDFDETLLIRPPGFEERRRAPWPVYIDVSSVIETRLSLRRSVKLTGFVNVFFATQRIPSSSTVPWPLKLIRCTGPLGWFLRIPLFLIPGITKASEE